MTDADLVDTDSAAKGGAVMSQSELAAEWGCSRQWVQQIEASAMAKLRANPKAREILRMMMEMGAGR